MPGNTRVKVSWLIVANMTAAAVMAALIALYLFTDAEGQSPLLRQSYLYAALLIVVVMAGSGFFAGKMLMRDLDALGQEAEKIQNMSLEDTVIKQSRLMEIDQLYRTVGFVKSTIRDLQETHANLTGIVRRGIVRWSHIVGQFSGLSKVYSVV